jgi:hypothetical protein
VAWQPTWSLLIAFNNGPIDDPSLITTTATPQGTLGANNVWTDVTNQLVGNVDTNRGRQHEVDRFQPGTLTCVLRNDDGRFDPWNTTGPYTGLVKPGCPVRFQAKDPTTSTVTAVYTGIADVWATGWPAEKSGRVTLSCVDLLSALNYAYLISNLYPAQVIADGAAAYWRFSDPVGSTHAADSSGHNRTSIVISGATFGETGALQANLATGMGLATGGAQGAIDFPPFTPSMTGVTVEFWFQSPSGAQDVLNINNTFTSPSISGGGLGLQWQVSTAGSTITAPLAYQDGLWHYFAWTLDGAHSTIYIDGASVVTHTDSTTSYSQYIPTYMFILNTSPTPAILLQEFAVYPTALNSTQVANHFGLGAAPGAEGSGARIERILNWVSVPYAGGNIDTGSSQIQGISSALTTTTILSYLQNVELTEDGAFFVNVAGALRFMGRIAALTSTTSTATFGDNTGGGEIPFELAPQLAEDTLDLYQAAVIQREGGQPQQWPATLSAFARTYQQSSLLQTTDSEALGYAQWTVNHFGTSMPRVRSVTVHPFVTPGGAATTALLGLDLMSVVTLSRHTLPGAGTAFSQLSNVEGINHHVDPTTGDWTVDLQLTPITATPVWVLGTSQLGTTTTLFF